ncbi:echinoidin-like [Apostichopus japonicus]|uniref:echinoidin-like n=1 Tax=Stichopus japonicus TaxID=307972 RepID=UPI003AB6CA8A
MLLMVILPVFLLAFTTAESPASECEVPCPLYWVPWRGNCYRYFAEEVSWYTALNFCRLFSTDDDLSGLADLVSIHSQEEHEFVFHFWKSFRARDTRPGLWIGLSDHENGRHEWSDRSGVDYTNFDAGQQSTVGQYLYLLYDSGDAHGKWHDVHDSSDWYFKFICKMPRY